MSTGKRKKKSWFKIQVAKVRILPWYWKLVVTIVLFFAGGSVGTQLFTAPDDLMMFFGFIVLVVVLWFLFQMWLPASKK